LASYRQLLVNESIFDFWTNYCFQTLTKIIIRVGKYESNHTTNDDTDFYWLGQDIKRGIDNSQLHWSMRRLRWQLSARNPLVELERRDLSGGGGNTRAADYVFGDALDPLNLYSFSYYGSSLIDPFTVLGAAEGLSLIFRGSILSDGTISSQFQLFWNTPNITYLDVERNCYGIGCGFGLETSGYWYIGQVDDVGT